MLLTARSSTDLPYHPHIFNTARTEDFLPGTMKIDSNDFTTRYEGHAIQGLNGMPRLHYIYIAGTDDVSQVLSATTRKLSPGTVAKCGRSSTRICVSLI